jgi:isopenicillin N synthase-like dioxygenase
MSSDFSSIPVIDLSLASNPSSKPQLLAQLREAITEIGFLYVKNHGVPESTIYKTVDVLPKLFSISQEAKDEVNLHNSPHFLGYSGVGAETTAKQADYREQFEFATELPDTYNELKDPLYTRLYGPNQVSGQDMPHVT